MGYDNIKNEWQLTTTYRERSKWPYPTNYRERSERAFPAYYRERSKQPLVRPEGRATEDVHCPLLQASMSEAKGP